MAAITLLPPTAAASTVTTRRTHRVYIKQAWDDDWTEETYLEPLVVTLCASPGITRCTFRYHATQVKREDSNVFTTDEPLAIHRWFVKVVLEPLSGGTSEILFLGRFSVEEQDIHGINGPLEGLPIDQLFTAYGLESLLDRMPITASWCINKAGSGTTFTGTAVPFEVDFPIEFNERLGIGLTAFGNRSPSSFDVGGRITYAFAGSQAAGTSGDPETWSALDIINYLYAFIVPNWMTIEIGAPGGNNVWAALNSYVQRYSADGKTVKQVFDELIHRQRGFGWWLKPVKPAPPDNPPDDLDLNTLPGETFKLDVFTIVDTDVTVDDKTLPANPNQVNLPVWTGHNQPVSYSTDDLTRYGVIRVVGERLVSCFTLSFADGTLEKAWTDEEEAAYKAVAGADAVAKDRARATDQFEHVWTTYRVPRAWDWKAGNGVGGTPRRMVNPQVDTETATLDYESAQAPSRDFGHRLLRTLPLRKMQSKADAEVEFRDLFAVIRDEQGRWHYIDRIEREGFPPAHVCPLDTEMGVRLTMHPNHLLARGHWNWSKADSQADPKAALSYTDIAATVAVMTDQRLMVEVEFDDDDITLGKKKVIEVPDAALWIVVPGTIVDVNADGSLNQYGGATVIRDDGARLRQVAALCEAYYGVPRAMLTVGIEEIYRPIHDGQPALNLGTYISRILLDSTGTINKEIGTVVTELTFDLENQRTMLQTSYAELDPAHKRKTQNLAAAVAPVENWKSLPSTRPLWTDPTGILLDFLGGRGNKS